MDQIKCPTTKSVNIRFLKNDKRIDIYISEPGKYAIIMDNKVMDAVEQPHQLANYIEGLNVLGFANHQIYIAYLPSTNDVSPSENSWTNRKKLSYRQEFSDRFNNISFRDGILPWLKFIELPDSEDSLLPKAVSMYIDYLEGLFGLRPQGRSTIIV